MNMNMNSVFALLILTILTSDAFASGRQGDTVTQTNENGTIAVTCVQVKTKGWRGQVFSTCVTAVRAINPETGVRDGIWEQAVATNIRANVSGDVLLALTGTVPAAAVNGIFAAKAAERLGCGERCKGTTITVSSRSDAEGGNSSAEGGNAVNSNSNSNTAEGGAAVNTNIPVTTIGVENNLTNTNSPVTTIGVEVGVGLACSGICPL